MNIEKVEEGRPLALPSKPVEIDPRSFPDPSARAEGPRCTIDNVRHMLEANGIQARYNIIKKKTEVKIPWSMGTAENADAVAMTHVQSLASRYGMPTGLVPAMVEALGDENSYNPAADWMNSHRWDGQDRLREICDTLMPTEGYPLWLRDVLVRKWLISIAAAALLPDGFKCRGVLTLQGPQGIGKTSWGLALVNDLRLRQQLIKVDHHLDASNKDSLLGVIDHLIAEIGELDSSFRRDVSRLKGFLTSGTDKVRRPYARVTVEYQRRTVFYATVNQVDFLVDDTGNKRWWTIPCAQINHAHGIDMQQVFAQCAVLLGEGAEWWLTPDEEEALEQQNSHHRSFSLVRDRLAAIIDGDAEDVSRAQFRTASEVLVAADFTHPTNAQAKECAGYLRERFGPHVRIQGRNGWRVPLRSGAASNDKADDNKPMSPKPKSRFD